MPTLRVCADPGNLPASNDRGEGYENRIAQLLARALHRDLQTIWAAEQRGFLRRFLLAGQCDVVMGVPAGLPPLLTTRPYLTDSYVMVTRRSARHHFTSFDDPWLRQARIGLPALGSDGANIPPAMALARRGLTDHLTGFPVLGHDSPQGRLIDAVARGRIDVAFAWGPVARYYAGRSPVQLQIDTITTDRRAPNDVFTFRLAAGVRPADRALRDAIQSALDAHRQEVAAILSEIDAPHAPPPPN